MDIVGLNLERASRFINMYRVYGALMQLQSFQGYQGAAGGRICYHSDPQLMRSYLLAQPPGAMDLKK